MSKLIFLTVLYIVQLNYCICKFEVINDVTLSHSPSFNISQKNLNYSSTKILCFHPLKFIFIEIRLLHVQHTSFHLHVVYFLIRYYPDQNIFANSQTSIKCLCIISSTHYDLILWIGYIKFCFCYSVLLRFQYFSIPCWLISLHTLNVL